MKVSDDYKNIFFESIEDAQLVLDDLNKIVTTYGNVTVADLYDLTSIISFNYIDNKYGWTDLSSVSVVSSSIGGYIITLPEPIIL